MIAVGIEQLLSFAQAAKLQPPGRLGADTNPATIWRWTTRGSHAVDGQIVKLECIRLGGRWLTSQEALQRFATRLSGQDPTDGATATTQPTEGRRTPAKRARASERAAEELEALGV